MNKILQRLFSKYLFTEWQRGYHDGLDKNRLDVAEAQKDTEEYWVGRVDKLVADKFSQLTCLVNPTDVLYASPNGPVFLGREQATKEEVKQLKEEVKAIKHFRLWEIMTETIKQKAIDKGMKDSTDFDQVLAGKMMLHNIGILKSIVETIDKLKI